MLLHAAEPNALESVCRALLTRMSRRRGRWPGTHTVVGAPETAEAWAAEKVQRGGTHTFGSLRFVADEGGACEDWLTCSAALRCTVDGAAVRRRSLGARAR